MERADMDYSHEDSLRNLRIIPKTFCALCLTEGRKMRPLGDLSHIYVKLFDTSMEESLKMVICWECWAVLRSANKFVNRVRKAQTVLLTKSGRKRLIASLSALAIEKLNNVVIEPGGDLEDNRDELIDNNNVEVKDEINVDDVAKDDGDDDDDEDAANNEVEDFISNNLALEVNDAENDATMNSVNEQLNDVDASPRIEGDVPGGIHKTKVKRKKHKKKKKDVKPIDGKKKNQPWKMLRKLDSSDYVKSYRRVYLLRAELDVWMQKDREDREYQKNVFRCEKCILSWPHEEQLRNHISQYHGRTTKFVCDVCGSNLSMKTALMTHLKTHFAVFECKLCGRRYHKQRQMFDHFYCTHRAVLHCTQCPLTFGGMRAFQKHYKELHRSFLCDHCGARCNTKPSIEKHIKSNHLPHKCEICNLEVTRHKLQYHIATRHSIRRDETTFCVECNKQYDSVTQFRTHILGSSRHAKERGIDERLRPSVACPACEKVYKSRSVMWDHYNFVHLKKTNHYCKECDRYFLNGERLKYHRKSSHEGWKPVKDKMCSVCGRAFAVNKVLRHHMRTHTGERPHQCPHCPTKFAQKYAMKTHVKNIHLKKVAP